MSTDNQNITLKDKLTFDKQKDLETIDTGKTYIRTIKALSLIWIGALIGYFLSIPSAFLRMWPQEVGSLLSGWFAPLAMSWVGVAVFLQRDSLKAIRAESARRDREQITAQIDRLAERLMIGIERLARIVDECGLFNPSNSNHRIELTEILGTYRKYADFSRSNEVGRSLDLLGNGLDLLVKRLKDDWVLDGSFEVLGDLCSELRFLDRITGEIEHLVNKFGIDSVNSGIPATSDLLKFRNQVMDADNELETIEQELRKLDTPENLG